MSAPEVFHIDPRRPDGSIIALAAQRILAGGLVVFPTETVYGLGANALDASAIEKIYLAKGRPSTNPLIVHVDSITQAMRLVKEWPPVAQKLVDHFWPGPLTVVLHRARQIPDVVTGGGPTVAIRWPVHPVAQALISHAGVPIAAPSANRSMQLSPTSAEHVLRGLVDGFDILLDGGPTTGGLESTVIDVTVDPPRLLRPGLISPGEIAEQIGPIERLDAPDGPGVGVPIRSPGQMSRHYAPQTPLVCVANNSTAREAIQQFRRDGKRIGWLKWGDSTAVPVAGVIEVAMPTDVSRYALRLYAELHELDIAQVDVILVTLPPEQEQWLAVRDRLRRASTSLI